MKSLILSIAAIMMAFSYSAFAGDNNKGNKEAKASNELKTETPADVKSNDDPEVYHWYDAVTGAYLSGITGPTENSPNSCNGSLEPCALGFLAPPSGDPRTAPADAIENKN